MGMRNLAALFGAVAALSACGGGGGNPGTCNASSETCNPPVSPPIAVAPTPSPSPTPAPTPTPAPPPSEQPQTAEGFFSGTSSNGRTAYAVIQDDGTFWLMYSVAGNPYVIGGAGQGHLNQAGSTIISNDLLDFNLEGLGISKGALTATFTPGSRIDGSIAYPNSTVSFGGTFDAKYRERPSPGALAGTYTADAVLTNARETVTTQVTADGKLTGSGPSGCSFGGTVAPRVSGNVFATKITFNGGPCALGTQTVDGVLYYDTTAGRVYGAALNAGRTGGYLFIGTRADAPSGGGSPSTPTTPTTPTLDPAKVTCANFTTQSQAQAFFLTYGAKQLDGDNDGRACEALP